MTLEEFRALPSAPTNLSIALQALWHDAQGDWEGAHTVIQNEEYGDGAWVHAYLHRKEGDIANAGYWYRRAQRPQAKGTLEEEWEQIVTALL
jgi:hypothetical protein